MANINVSKGF
jgi:hypothetical protein